MMVVLNFAYGSSAWTAGAFFAIASTSGRTRRKHPPAFRGQIYEPPDKKSLYSDPAL